LEPGSARQDQEAYGIDGSLGRPPEFNAGNSAGSGAGTLNSTRCARWKANVVDHMYQNGFEERGESQSGDATGGQRISSARLI